jgi:LPXTG-motif cell wall-anchored protein
VDRRFNGLEPRVAHGSLLTPEHPVAKALVRPPSSGGSSTPLVLLLAAAGAAGLGALLIRRRRGGGDVVVVDSPIAPSAPSYVDPAVEAELHEIIAEERARALLSGEPGEQLESTESR